MKTEIAGIAKTYRNKPVLKDVSFGTDSGKIIGIKGDNGSGKSTLLGILAGMIKQDAGSFFFMGEDLLKDKKRLMETVGLVPQENALFDELNAYDNLLMWYDKKTIKKSLEDGLCKRLKIDEMLKVAVHKMSGGMKKRLSIACTAIKEPPILLLDEPSASLDIAGKKEIIEFMKEYVKADRTIILVTHDEVEIGICDEVYLLEDERLTNA